MLRRKPNTWVQVNLRIKEELRRKLEAAAKEGEVSFNEEVRARLEDSFRIESLDSMIAAVPKRIRSIVGDAIAEALEAKSSKQEREEGGRK